MEKLKLHTPNLTAENIEKLAALFPNCVTETADEKTGQLKRAIDFDQLRQELSNHIVEGPRERYHLDWPGKREALLAANAPIAKTLRPCREESVDFDTTKNLFIEGDNLDALKLLQEMYLGKVKMIYIDPPYNTGADLLYEDSFDQDSAEFLERSNQIDNAGMRLVVNTESNGRFHSDWLTMMYPRLKLARNLLRDDGVMFISIDDHESGTLRLVCDEIFGADNFLCTFAWLKRYSTPPDTKDVGFQHENILCYRKSGAASLNPLPMSDDQVGRYKNPDNDPRGPWKAMDYTCRYTADERPNLYYPIENPNTGESILPKRTRVWAMSRAVTERNLIEQRIWWGTDGTNSVPALKNFLSEVKQGRTPGSFLHYDDVGHTDESAKELRILIPEVKFTPKPTRLIRHLALLATDSESIVVDFFCGSATTAHALMALNAEDGGSRRFVMVQFPEACEETSDAFKAGFTNIAVIAKQRIRRAGAKIKTESASIAPNLDTGFRVLKIDTSNMNDVYYAPDAVQQDQLALHTDNIKEDRSPEDLLFQVLVDWGVDLALPIEQQQIAGKTVFFVDGNALAACFDTHITEDLVKELAKRKPLRAVFRDSSFESDSTKINVAQIFKLLSPETEVKSL